MQVTSKKDQQQYWEDNEKPYMFITAREFAAAFRLFHVGQRLMSELAIPFDKTKSHHPMTKCYGVSNTEILKACFSREVLLMRRNSLVYIFKLFQLSAMGIIATTLFPRTNIRRDNLTDGRIFIGALFFVTVTVMFSGMAEIVMGILRLPIFYKQRNLLFYPAWAYALPLWILSVPVNVVEIAVITVLTYYEIGFDPNFERFVKYYLLLLILMQASSSLFWLIGAIGRDMVIAFIYGYFMLVLVFVLSGFVLPRDKVNKWWIWGYYISPMMYAENAILVNEFRGHSWKHVFPNGNVSLGVEISVSQGFFPGSYWYWIGVGALLGMAIIFNSCFILALTYLNYRDKPQAVAVLLEDENEVLSENLVREDKRKKREAILPFEPYSIAFNEVNYSIDMPREMRNHGGRLVLLKGVSGAFRPGVLTTLMGVSVAGKTTLMDVLAGRKTSGYIEESITISGYPKKQETFARISGYSEQNDIHSPYVTVYESLLFSAWLRLPPKVNPETRKAFIENVTEVVELREVRGGLVGLGGVSGLSTEQRKCEASLLKIKQDNTQQVKKKQCEQGAWFMQNYAAAWTSS
ncbi:hypothetical protein ACS0TY_035843 [Phlomoides rotata]